ncbi:MAG: SDR family NAD(P)-dependent oxidoreductase [Acidimicrobiales bacterium]
MELEGRVAAITGGTRGIGRAIAEAFVADGASVVINGRSPEKGQRALEEMDAGENVHFIAGDVTDQAVCEALVDQTVEHYGRIDIMVNNAGGGGDTAPVVDMGDDSWLRVIDWNLNHPFWCTRRSLKYMIPQGWGRIINISSMYGKLALPANAHYVTTKHALNGLTKAVAQEVGEQGITCNALCPGGILTDVQYEQGPPAAEAMGITFEELLDFMAQPSAIKRLNEVEDVALVASLLASDAGGGINGSLISIDGGVSPY